MFEKISLLQVVIFICLCQHNVGGNMLLTDKLGQCSDLHVQQAVENIEICKPRPTVVQLPWPNKTEVHQVCTM